MEATVPTGKLSADNGKPRKHIEAYQDIIRLSRAAIERSFALLTRVGHPDSYPLRVRAERPPQGDLE
jgi:hypothetical protein